MTRLSAQDRRDIVKDFVEQHVYREASAPSAEAICRNAHEELKTMRGFNAELTRAPLPLAERQRLAIEYRRALRDHVDSFCESESGGKFAGVRARRRTRRR